MSTNRFDESEFQSNSERIAQDIENTLERVVNDYPEHWKGVISEWIQNAYDAWCHNRYGRETIPKDQGLVIEFTVDLNKRLFVARDNAGGMPEHVFTHHFAGLDTPGEEKQSGDFGGSYGRGQHVISGAGETMYAETLYDDGAFRGGLVVKGARQLRTDPDLYFEDDGTVVELQDVDPDTLVKLTDWSRIERYIQSRFQGLLEHDDVTIKYSIDNETHEAEPMDLSGFDVLFETESITFEHGGEEHEIRDIVIYDATSHSETVPIGGIAMQKANQHVGKPFMRVQDYRPRQLRHLDKMFGFCDASGLCPDYENNAHNSFTGNIVTSTGLKDLLEDLERQYFIGTPTDLDAKDKIINETLEIVNSQWDYNPFDDGTPDFETDFEGEDDEPGDDETIEIEVPPNEDNPPVETDEPDTQNRPDEDEDDDNGDDFELDWEDEGSEDKDEPDIEDPDDDTDEEERVEPEISCSARGRQFAVNDEITIWFVIDNPSRSRTTEFTVVGELEHDDSGDVNELGDQQVTVDSGKSSTGDDKFVVTPDEPGKYTFRAYLYPVDADDYGPEVTIDQTFTWFYAGSDLDEEGAEVDSVAFLEQIVLVRDEDNPEFRTQLQRGDRGMILVANTRHPEWLHAVSLDGRTGTKNQILTLVRYSHERIMTRLLTDEIDHRLADVYGDDGRPMSEELNGFIKEYLEEQTSALIAGAHEQL